MPAPAATSNPEDVREPPEIEIGSTPPRRRPGQGALPGKREDASDMVTTVIRSGATVHHMDAGRGVVCDGTRPVPPAG